MIKKVLFFVLIAGFANCQTGSKNATNDKLNPGFSYKINQPDKTFEMPTALQEISGLSLAEDGNLLTLNDEVGKVFKLNKEDGKIMMETVFKADGGDFEGIEMVGNTVYASSSKGKIYEISNYLDANSLKVEKYSSDLLTKESDVEGLGYDMTKKVLLLACKGSNRNTFERELWGFDIQTKTYSDKPILTLTLTQIQTWLKSHDADKDAFKDLLEDNPTEFHFGTSGFAVHPKSGNYYFLSSPGKLLVVTNPSGEIQNILKLDKKIHAQPEGIVFDKDGTMYISNEGKKESTPKVYQFKEVLK